jgi:hydroxymethylglutaryl-CoA reductase (NADPH)
MQSTLPQLAILANLCYNSPTEIAIEEPIMPAIPPFVLKKLYVKGSLRAEDDGFALTLRNSIAPGVIVAFTGLDVDGQSVRASQITVTLPNGDTRPASEISTDAPLPFPADATITLRTVGQTLNSGPHELAIHVVVQEVGPLELPISDMVA